MRDFFEESGKWVLERGRGAVREGERNPRNAQESRV